METSEALHWSQTTTTTTTATTTTTTATTPPKFTICHQNSSMEGPVERYNINMQEAQHVAHQSTALHLMYVADTAPPIGDVNRQLLNFIEIFELTGSRWVFSKFQSLQLTLWQLGPSRGSAFIPLPRWIQTRMKYDFSSLSFLTKFHKTLLNQNNK